MSPLPLILLLMPEHYITDIKEHIYITLRLLFSLWIWCKTCRKFHHISRIIDFVISFSQVPLLLNRMLQNEQLIVALRNYTLYLLYLINSNPNSRQGFSSLRDLYCNAGPKDYKSLISTGIDMIPMIIAILFVRQKRENMI